MTRMSWDDYFIGIATAVSARASCSRRQVGAVLVDKSHRVIGTGYNGAPSGAPDCLHGACPRGLCDYDAIPAGSSYDDPLSSGYCVAVHAEANAILQSGRDAAGATMYVTDDPCTGCSTLIRAAGVSRIYTPGGEW